MLEIGKGVDHDTIATANWSSASLQTSSMLTGIDGDASFELDWVRVCMICEYKLEEKVYKRESEHVRLRVVTVGAGIPNR